MSKILKYTLEDFSKIAFNGFDFNLPKETIDIISDLSRQVGSPNYVKTPVFKKRDSTLVKDNSKKKQYKKNDINDDDWETIRTFQPTKIEKKIGLDAKFDTIRSYLNKITDKNYIDLSNKIVESIEDIIKDNNNEDIFRLGTSIFEIASTNRFYSKLYADLYANLISNFEIMREVFYTNFDKFLGMFETIEYIDPVADYDKFCKINSDNEKRKALSAFFINLMTNNVIPEEKIVLLLNNLLTQINSFINIANKKNEVDEITENVAILYKKELFKNNKYHNYKINEMTIPEIITLLSQAKPKDYLSITNKSIFKFMDMTE